MGVSQPREKENRTIFQTCDSTKRGFLGGLPPKHVTRRV